MLRGMRGVLQFGRKSSWEKDQRAILKYTPLFYHFSSTFRPQFAILSCSIRFLRLFFINLVVFRTELDENLSDFHDSLGIIMFQNVVFAIFSENRFLVGHYFLLRLRLDSFFKAQRAAP